MLSLRNELLGFSLVFQEEMIVQENPIELEKIMAWSRRSKLSGCEL